MTAHRVAELEGALLDAAVAKALGYAVPGGWDYPTLWSDAKPSSNWQHGGPIIERERIDWHERTDSTWEARCGEIDQPGGTQLIAAMRAYVASRLGDTVELT